MAVLANSTSSLALARAMIMSYEGGVFHLLKLFEGSRDSTFMSHSDPGYLRYDRGRAVTVSTEGKVDGREVRWLQAPETRKDRVLKIVAVASDQVGATVTLEGGFSFIVCRSGICSQTSRLAPVLFTSILCVRRTQ